MRNPCQTTGTNLLRSKLLGWKLTSNMTSLTERSGVKLEPPWVEVGVRSTRGGSGGQTTVPTLWRCGTSTTFTGSTKKETTSLYLLQEESIEVMLKLDY